MQRLDPIIKDTNFLWEGHPQPILKEDVVKDDVEKDTECDLYVLVKCDFGAGSVFFGSRPRSFRTARPSLPRYSVEQKSKATRKAEWKMMRAACLQCSQFVVRATRYPLADDSMYEDSIL